MKKTPTEPARVRPIVPLLDYQREDIESSARFRWNCWADHPDRHVDIQEAVQHLQRVVADRPAFPEAHYNLGVAVFMSGRPADALPHIHESIRLNPNDAQAKAFLEVLLLEIK